MGWTLGSFSTLQTAWAHKSADQAFPFRSNLAAQDLPLLGHCGFQADTERLSEGSMGPHRYN